MAEERIAIIHYLNQFFSGLGGEEQASLPPQAFAGPRGPGVLLERLDPRVEVIATVTAGDNYLAEHLSAGVAEVVALIRDALGEQPLAPGKPGAAVVFLAGPAFNAGRYGLACAELCKSVEQQLGLPAVTAMYQENPAVEMFRKDVVMVRTGPDVMSMRSAAATMLEVVSRRVRGLTLNPSVDGTIPRGVRENHFADQTGAERALSVLLKKVQGVPFETEYAMPVFDRVSPAAPVDDCRLATIGLVTSGGIVPRGNPDRIPSASAGRFGAYSLEGLERLSPLTHQSVHGGYDPTHANADPNRVLPLDVLRELEREGRIGKLSPTYYATVGNATSVKDAARLGAEIAALLVNEGVQAVIFTST